MTENLLGKRVFFHSAIAAAVIPHYSLLQSSRTSLSCHSMVEALKNVTVWERISSFFEEASATGLLRLLLAVTVHLLRMHPSPSTVWMGSRSIGRIVIPVPVARSSPHLLAAIAQSVCRLRTYVRTYVCTANSWSIMSAIPRMVKQQLMLF